MPLIAYKKVRFHKKTRAQIDKANAIIEEYRQQGFELTLRQLYYQFVARGIIANKHREYKNLGQTINDARLAGLIDWYSIHDRTRNLLGLQHWSDPEQIIRSCVHSYRLARWENQPYRLEVWIEKDALVGVIKDVCQRNDVDYFSCRGYTSQSEMWSAGQRLASYSRRGKTPIILHLGDHDPSGVDMSRDIADRLELFVGEPVEVDRLALNWDQITQYKPPPNPCKITDSRAKSYIDRFGRESWELDALEPKVIANLIQTAIDRRKDHERWRDIENAEDRDIAAIQQAANRMTNDLSADSSCGPTPDPISALRRTIPAWRRNRPDFFSRKGNR